MAQTTGSTTLQSESGEGGERVPIMQQILDNPFLLLFIGVTVPTVFYILTRGSFMFFGRIRCPRWCEGPTDLDCQGLTGRKKTWRSRSTISKLWLGTTMNCSTRLRTDSPRSE